MIETVNHLNRILAVLVQALWPLAWQGAIWIALVWAVTRLWRRGPASFRYGLWCLVLVKLLLPIQFALPTGAVNALPEITLDTVIQTVAQDPIQLEQAAPPVAPVWSWAGWLGLGWIAGVLAVLAWGVVRFRQVRGLLLRSSVPVAASTARVAASLAAEIGLRWPVTVLESESVASPLVLGPAQPLVIVPGQLFADLEPDEQRALLAHELFHIRRRDHQLAVLELLALAIHFFNPFAWLALRRLRAERERACDEAVMGLLEGKTDPYGSGLLKVIRFQKESSQSLPGVLALAERGSDLGERIFRILNPSRRRIAARTSIVSALVLIAVACAMLPGKAQNKKADSPKASVAEPAGATTPENKPNSPQPDGLMMPFENVKATGPIAYNESGEATIEGGTMNLGKDGVFRADKIVVDKQRRQVTATGHVEWTKDFMKESIKAQSGVFELDMATRKVILKESPTVYHIRGNLIACEAGDQLVIDLDGDTCTSTVVAPGKDASVKPALNELETDVAKTPTPTPTPTPPVTKSDVRQLPPLKDAKGDHFDEEGGELKIDKGTLDLGNMGKVHADKIVMDKERKRLTATGHVEWEKESAKDSAQDPIRADAGVLEMDLATRKVTLKEEPKIYQRRRGKVTRITGDIIVVDFGNDEKTNIMILGNKDRSIKSSFEIRKDDVSKIFAPSPTPPLNLKQDNPASIPTPSPTPSVKDGLEGVKIPRLSSD